MMIFFFGVESWTANAGWRLWGRGTHLRWETLSWFWNFKFRIRCPLETAFLRLRGDGNLGIGEIRLLFVLFCQKKTIFYSFVLSRRLHGLDNLCAKCGALWTHTRLLPHGCSVQALLYWKGWAYGYGFALKPIKILHFRLTKKKKILTFSDWCFIGWIMRMEWLCWIFKLFQAWVRLDSRSSSWPNSLLLTITNLKLYKVLSFHFKINKMRLLRNSLNFSIVHYIWFAFFNFRYTIEFR